MAEEFTEQEKREAATLAAQLADGGKFERETKTAFERVRELTEAGGENHACLLIAHREDIGKTMMSFSGTGIDIIAMLISVCQKDETFKALFMEAASYLAKKSLKDILRERLNGEN
jgi:hypothetical protein